MGKFLKTHTHKNRFKKKLSLQLFLMANFDRVNEPIDMRVQGLKIPQVRCPGLEY
jgi:hypothetical protein